MTSYVGHWKVGSTSEWRGPFGNFSYSPNKVADWYACVITCGLLVCMWNRLWSGGITSFFRLLVWSKIGMQSLISRDLNPPVPSCDVASSIGGFSSRVSTASDKHWGEKAWERG